MIPPPSLSDKKKRQNKINTERDFTLKEKRKFNICFIQTAIVPDNVLCIIFVICHKSTTLM